MEKAQEKPQSVGNPNGANQWVADPRQQLFLAYYLDPKSKTFSNALKSGLRAGFSQQYAENILNLMPDWLSEKLGKSRLLLKAERNIEEALELPSMTQAMGPFGPIFESGGNKGKKGAKAKGPRKPIMVYNPSLLKLKAEASFFVAETVGKAKYSKKGDGMTNIFNVAIFENGQRTRIAKRIIGGGSAGDKPGKE